MVAPGVVIVGAGMAGAQAAMALRTKGYEGPVTLVGDETHPPYQRPPLSKAYLVEEDAAGVAVHLRPEAFWADKEIDVLGGARASAIDRAARTVALDDGRELPYAQLVLATGSRNRPLPAAEGVLALRTLDDAAALRERLGPGRRLVVVGGGFIGLEVAAAARKLDAEVVVVEALDRVMARIVSPELSAFFQALHEREGVRVLTGRRVERAGATEVVLDGGEVVAADAVVAGVGVVPNAELAAAAGLAVDDGIVVDEQLRTSDPAIWAIGDCARFPCAVSARVHRLESVQNATDQARHVAAAIAGEPARYAAVPWFWTDQFGRKLQIAGAAPDGALAVPRGAPGEDGFSICRFAGDRLVAIESVDRMADHIAARKLLAGPAAAAVTPAQAADLGVSLKELAAAAG